MNEPHTKPIDELQAMERAGIDSINAISMAMAHSLVLGVSITQQVDPLSQARSPTVVVHVPPKPPEIPTDPPGKIQVLALTIPRDGVNIAALMMSAGHFCHGLLCQSHQRGDIDASDYLKSKDAIEKMRRDAKGRIIIPSKS